MKTRILRFVDALRSAGVPVSVGESIDAMHAVLVAGVERAVLREALAAALVKDQTDRPVFDATFDRFFGAHSLRRRKTLHTARGDKPNGKGPPEHDSEADSRTRIDERRVAKRAALRPGPDRAEHLKEDSREPMARQRQLANMPFRQMSPRDIEECGVLVAALAHRFRRHLSRRNRVTSRGRLDIRRTLRRSVCKGGVPIEPAYRHRKPGRPDLVALCDLSYSVTTASHFLLALLAPAQDFVRRTRLFAFVDRPVEISVESGVVVPHEAIDLYGRSDFGKVLKLFEGTHKPLLTRNTILLILGDARNNRRPPRADLLRRMAQAVKQVVWLNPEPLALWNTGDSVIRSYAPHCGVLLRADNLRELHSALQQTLRPT